MRSILIYHVFAGSVFAGDVVKLSSAPSVQGSPIAIDVSGGSVKLNGSSTVIITDILTTNGVIHGIDTVILPPQK